MIVKQHEIYSRRGRKNTWLGVIMGCLVAVIFLVTIAKLATGDKMQAFDHSLRPEMVESENEK
jgi:hypothetical protein